MVWTEALALAKAASNCYSPGPVATAPVVDSTAVSGMIAPARCTWTPPWSENHSHSYGLSEGQVQARLDKRGPG